MNTAESNTPKVSIIIPHFNRSHILRSTVDSVIAQTYIQWELLIIDDGSESEQLKQLSEIINSDKRIKFASRTSEVKGPSACRNLGAKLAKGTFLLFLDSDDLLAPFCLDQRMKVMVTIPNTKVGIFLIEEFETMPGDRKNIYNISANSSQDLIGLFIKNINPWQTMAPLWVKNYFYKIGGFDEELLYMEDPYLHLKVLLNSKNVKTFYNLPPDCYYRVNFHDHTKKDFYYNSVHYRLLFYKKIYKYLNDKPGSLEKYIQDIRQGVLTLLNNFMLSRINEFPALYDDLITWLTEIKLFNAGKLNRIKLAGAIYRNNSLIVKKLRLKGLANKFILK